MEEFDAAKLSHRRGQEGIVRIEDKAHVMAEKENSYQDIATKFDSYLSNPETVDEESSMRFGAYKRENITPDDLRIIGDRLAELKGAGYDYQQEALAASSVKLRLDAHVFGLVALKNGLQSGYVPSESGAVFPVTNEKHEAWLRGGEALIKKEIARRELEARYADKKFPNEGGRALRERDVPTLDEFPKDLTF